MALANENEKRRNLEFKELINSPMFGASRIVRYAGLHMAEKETLADHVYEIGTLSLLIARKLEALGISINKGKLLERAVIHDMEETITNDIPRPVKHASYELKSLMDSMAKEYMDIISEKVGVDFTSEWLICKDNTSEGWIIKVADLILVARKVYYEVAYKSNFEFLAVLLEVIHYLEELRYLIVRTKIGTESSDMKEVLNFLFKLVDSTHKECMNLKYSYAEKFSVLTFTDRIKK